MTEEFLHFIWKYGLFRREGMVADTGEEVSVISLGEHNGNAGPDFLNARVVIGNTIWAGNVEMHLRSSDWVVHGHHQDKAYDNVVLHVVCQYNGEVKRSDGEIIPTVELSFNPDHYENYRGLLDRKSELPCGDKLSRVDNMVVSLWLNALAVERLGQKTQMIAGMLEQYKNDLEAVFYIVLARSFGFGLNAEPFELLARSLPFHILQRHRDNPLQAEALLLGQAGFLEDPLLFEDYFSKLRAEYLHLKNKYQLKPLPGHIWKFLRLRPMNFPTVRIAQFAALMSKTGGLFSRAIACSQVKCLHQLFNVCAAEFWNTHYTFDTPSPERPKALGAGSVNILLINTVIPFLFHYGSITGREDTKELALTWLSQLPPEKNRIVSRWEHFGRKPVSALDSQALIQLSQAYCKRKRCLSCSIGVQVIRAM